MRREDIGLIVGIGLIGATACVVWSGLSGAFARSEEGGGWINQYQSLLAGVLAVVAAGLTIVWMQKGLRQTAELAADARRRDLESARAVLPLALSAVSNYAVECAKLLRVHLVRMPPGAMEHFGGPIPAPPTDAITVFRDCIRSAPADKAEELATLLRQLQIQNARLHSSANQNVLRLQLAQWVLDSADLYGRASNLFAFGRGENFQMEKLDRAAIESALVQIGIGLDDDEVHRLFETRWPPQK